MWKTAGIAWLWTIAGLMVVFLAVGWWRSPSVVRIKKLAHWISRTFFSHPAPRFVDDPHVRVPVSDNRDGSP